MTVHVFATGGTITSHFDGTAWTNVDGPTLVTELGDLGVDVQVHDVAAGPSSNLGIDDMVAIARRVESALADGAQGVVVVHGTDTMELTAFTTQLVLGTQPGRRPVVFTGSMRVHSHPTPDGPDNLRRAIAVAAGDEAVGGDVLVCMGHELHTADRVRKHLAMSTDAFHSLPFAPAGSVAGEHGPAVLTAPPTARRPATGIDTRVALVTCYPGITAQAAEAAAAGAVGVVVEGFGDLNVPHAVWGPIHAAANAGALVVIASSAFTSNVGDEGMRALGAVGAGGLTAQKARLALMAALGTEPTDRDAAIDFLHQYALAFDAGDRSTTP